MQRRFHFRKCAHLVEALMVGIGSLQPEAVKEPAENA